MLDLHGRQRDLLADKAEDTANIAAGALVFGQFLSDRGPSLLVGVVGLALSIVFAVTSVLLARRQQPCARSSSCTAAWRCFT